MEFTGIIASWRKDKSGGMKLTLDVSSKEMSKVMEYILKKGELSYHSITFDEAEDIGFGSGEIENPVKKEKGIREKMMAKVHAIIRDISISWEQDQDEVRKTFKDKLKEEGQIEESFTELSDKSLGKLIERLEHVLTIKEKNNENNS